MATGCWASCFSVCCDGIPGRKDTVRAPIRFNDIVLPGQNWVTDQPANVRGQCVRKRGRQGGALLRYALEIYYPHYRLCSCRMFALYATRSTSFCAIYKLKEITKIDLYFASQRHGWTPPFLIQPCSPPD